MQSEECMKLRQTVYALPFEGLLHSLGFPVQSFSLIHLLIIPFYSSFLKKIELTILTKTLIIFLCYLFLVSLIHLNINLICYQQYDSLYYFSRQLISLLFGVIFYVYIRKLFILYDEILIVKSILYTLLIIVFFAILDKLSGYSRIESTFSEPSHLGQYIVFIIIPLLYMYNYQLSKKLKLILWPLSIILLILTLSSTTFIRLFLFVGSIYLFKKKNFIDIFILVSLIFGLGYFLIILLPYLIGENYMNTMISLTIKGLNGEVALPLSVIDRMNFYFVIFNMHLNLHTLFGYGLGGDSIHYKEFLPENIYSQILSVKSIGYSTNSFLGKIFIYSGLLGTSIFLIYIFLLFKNTKYLFDNSYKIKAILFAILVYSTIGIGAYTMVVIWFWFALIDGKYIIYRRTIA